MVSKWQCDNILGNVNAAVDLNNKMGDIILRTTVKDKDLGITISADMKVS